MSKSKRRRGQKAETPADTAEKPRGQGKITVARTGDVREVSYREGITVKDALSEAQFTVDGASEIRVNNKPANQGTCLRPGDQVLILGKIRGA